MRPLAVTVLVVVWSALLALGFGPLPSWPPLAHSLSTPTVPPQPPSTSQSPLLDSPSSLSSPSPVAPPTATAVQLRSALFPPTPILTPCDLNFTALDDLYRFRDLRGYGNFPVPISQFQSIAAACPANCTALIAQSAKDNTNISSSSRVFGSYPYHGSSSVCLSAIHSGVILDSEGGGVFVSRFYRADWSGSDSQSIFPLASAGGSDSNGVVSEAVADSWYSVPSHGREWSYAVRGRGELVVQRREAPWPARAGHLHQRWQLQPRLLLGPSRPRTDEFPNPQDRSYSIHLIMGGHNATHYLNDVSAHPHITS